jgi:putative sterol carrier protein
MPIDVEKLFDEKLAAVLARQADEARSIDASYQMNIEGAGRWHVDLTRKGPLVERGQKPADCTVSLSSDDFQKLYDDPASGVTLFLSGRLKITGNVMLALRLQKLFSLR